MSRADRPHSLAKVKPNLKPIHAMKTKTQTQTQGNPRVYVLKPADFALSAPNPLAAPKASLSNIAVSMPATLPPRQPLPRPVIDPSPNT